MQELVSLGYRVIFIWESEFVRWSEGIVDLNKEAAQQVLQVYYGRALRAHGGTHAGAGLPRLQRALHLGVRLHPLGERRPQVRGPPGPGRVQHLKN